MRLRTLSVVEKKRKYSLQSRFEEEKREETVGQKMVIPSLIFFLAS